MPTKDEIQTENEQLKAKVDELQQALLELKPQDDVTASGSDVMTQLAEAQQRAATLAEENTQLRSKLADAERQLRGASAVETEAPAEAPELTDDGLCSEHFPDGWAGVPESAAGVGCEHGSFTRPSDK